MNSKGSTHDLGMICWNCGKKTQSLICEHCGANQLRKPTDNEKRLQHSSEDNEGIPSLNDTFILVTKKGKKTPSKISMNDLKEIVEAHLKIKRIIIKKKPIFLIMIPASRHELNEKLEQITEKIHEQCTLLYPRIIPKKQKNIIERFKDEKPKEKEAYLLFQQLKEQPSNLQIAWISFIIGFFAVLVTGFLVGQYYNQGFQGTPNLLYDEWMTVIIISGGIILLLGIRIYLYYSISHDLQLAISKPLIIPSIPFFNIGILGILIDPVKPTKERDGLLVLYLFPAFISLVISLIVFILGVFMSVQGNNDEFLRLVLHGKLPFLAQIIILLMVKLKIIETSTIILSPIAYVGLSGMIINGLALLPIPMLDGGKMFRNWLSSKELIGISIIFVLYMLLQQEWVIAVFILLMTQFSDELRPLNEISQTSAWLKYFVFLAFLLGLISVFPPISGSIL